MKPVDFSKEVAHTGVQQSDIDCANWLLRTYPLAMIGGSFVVDRHGANDIDVFIPYSVFTADSLYTHTVMDKYPDFVETTQQNDVYQHDDCIRHTFRRDGLNLIVVADEFYSAYCQAVWIMSANPARWRGDDKKEDRAKLHESLRNEIRGWISTYA